MLLFIIHGVLFAIFAIVDMRGAHENHQRCRQFVMRCLGSFAVTARRRHKAGIESGTARRCANMPDAARAADAGGTHAAKHRAKEDTIKKKKSAAGEAQRRQSTNIQTDAAVPPVFRFVSMTRLTTLRCAILPRLPARHTPVPASAYYYYYARYAITSVAMTQTYMPLLALLRRRYGAYAHDADADYATYLPHIMPLLLPYSVRRRDAFFI